MEKTSLESGPSLKPPSLSQYLDFRRYLRDFYEFKRKTTPGLRGYSYSVFSAAANIRSPNYLKLIIDGQRNLSDEMVRKFARALHLQRLEGEEFFWLVSYGQESDPLRRNQHLQKLTAVRVQKQIERGEILAEQWRRVPDWVTWILYAMADQKNVDFTPQMLKPLFRGKASEEAIRLALEKLFELGQFTRDAQGQVRKSRELMDAASDIPVALVRKLQTELNYLGMESLFQDEADEREFGALTLSLTPEEFAKIKFELRQMRKRLHRDTAVARSQKPGDRVYQLNIQLFPVTDPVNSQ